MSELKDIKRRIHLLLTEKEVLKKHINYSGSRQVSRRLFDKLTETEKKVQQLQFRQQLLERMRKDE